MAFLKLLVFILIVFHFQTSFANQTVKLGGKNFFISNDSSYELIKKTGSIVDVYNVDYLYFAKKNNGKIDYIIEVKVGAHLKMREYTYINYDTNCKLKNQIYIKKRIGDSFNCWFIGAYDYFKDQDNFEETYSNPHSPPTFMFNGGIKYFLKKNISENIKFVKSSHNFFATTHGGRHYIVNYLTNYKNIMSTNDYNNLRLGIVDNSLKKKLIKHFEYNQFQFESALNIQNVKRFSLVNKSFETKKIKKDKNDSISNELLKLKKLLDQGVITKDEFKKAKSKILN